MLHSPLRFRSCLFILALWLAASASAQELIILRRASHTQVIPLDDEVVITLANKAQEKDLVQASIVNPWVEQFLREVHYKGTPDESSQVERYLPLQGIRGDHPRPILLAPPQAEAQRLRLRDHAGWPITLPLDGAPTALSSLLPEQAYTLQWLESNDQRPLGETTLYLKGELRMLPFEAVPNVRDLGGWRGLDGRRVRHGLLYRGAQLHNPRQGTVMTAADSAAFRRLGIRAELDLRGNIESGRIAASPLGADVRYYRIAGGGIYPYDEMITRFPKDIKEVFDALLLNLREHRPTYIHCFLGADRTGTVVFLLNGILGVSLSDLIKDYELSSFSPIGLRTLHFRPDAPELNLAEMIRLLQQRPGHNLCERLEGFFLEAGITPQEIDEFRAFMLE